jgi:hypothetical protein
MNLEKILKNPPMKNNYIGDGKNYKEIDYDKWKQQIQKLMLREEELKSIFLESIGLLNEENHECEINIDYEDLAIGVKAIFQKMKERMK